MYKTNHLYNHLKKPNVLCQQTVWALIHCTVHMMELDEET